MLSTSVQIVNAQHISTDVKQALALLDNVMWSLPLILSPLNVQIILPKFNSYSTLNKYFMFTKQETQIMAKKYKTWHVLSLRYVGLAT